MAPVPQYTEETVRRALIAWAHEEHTDVIAKILGLRPDSVKGVLLPYIRKYGIKRGFEVPHEVHALGRKERFANEPEHVRAHKRIRRGFNLPASKENSYIDLLKQGLSIAEARERLGVG